MASWADRAAGLALGACLLLGPISVPACSGPPSLHSHSELPYPSWRPWLTACGLGPCTQMKTQTSHHMPPSYPCNLIFLCPSHFPARSSYTGLLSCLETCLVGSRLRSSRLEGCPQPSQGRLLLVQAIPVPPRTGLPSPLIKHLCPSAACPATPEVSSRCLSEPTGLPSREPDLCRQRRANPHPGPGRSQALGNGCPLALPPLALW